MELEDFKHGWQAAGAQFKTAADLQKMTRLKNHPGIRKIRRKLMIETVLLTLFLFLYYDGFDGDQKPIHANLLLVSSVLLYISNSLVLYFSLVNLSGAGSLKLSFRKYLQRLKRLSTFSVLLSFLYGLCLLLFFTAVIQLTGGKSMVFLALVLFVLLSTYWSYTYWAKRIRQLTKLAKEFEEAA